jgi:hypothetical protein
VTDRLLFKAQVDELSISHATRLIRVNNLNKGIVSKGVRTLLQRTSEKNTKDMPIVYALAKLGNMDAGEYVQQHTTFPILRFSAWPEDIYPHRLTPEGTIRIQGLKVPRTLGLICPECIEDQIKETGYSWYRRRHHLFGVDWCDIHGSPLRNVTDLTPQTRSPDEWLRGGQTMALSPRQKHLENTSDFIKKFVALSARAYDLTAPVSALLLRVQCAIQAKTTGLRITYLDRRPTLSDFVRKTAPSDWLKTHLPELLSKPAYDFISGIDDLLYTRNQLTSESSMMGLAALFDKPLLKLEQLSRNDPIELVG